MIFGVLNPEKIWHQQVVHFSTSPAYCGHFALANMSNPILIITALRNNLVRLRLTFNTVVWWRKLGDVKNEYILHYFSLCAIFL